MTTVNVNEDKYSVTVTEGATTVVTVKAPGPQGPGFPDGNLGDVTSSNTGASVVVNSGAITNAKVNDSAAIAGTKISPDFGSQNITTTGNAVFGGNLTVSGTTTTIDTTTLRVEDKNIELGKVGSPTDITADGGGITLLGDTNHTFNWVNATDSWTSSEHIGLPDNKKLQLGDSQDLQLFHDSSHSNLKNTTGNFSILSDTILLKNAANSESFIRCQNDGVEVYHANSLKLATYSGGFNLTGKLNVTGDIDIPDNSKLLIGTGDDLEIFHDGSSHSYFRTTAGGIIVKSFADLQFRSDNIQIKSAALENYITCTANGSVELYHDNVKRFETKNYGALIHGALVTTSDVKVGSYVGKLIVGTSNEFTIQHDDTDTFIENTTGNLHIRPKTGEEGIKLIPDGSVELYHDNVKKVETVSNGLNVEGTVTCDDILVANTIKHEGQTNTKIEFDTTVIKFDSNGVTRLQVHPAALFVTSGYKVAFIASSGESPYIRSFGTNNGDLQIGQGTESMAQFKRDGAVELYHNGTKKLETTSSGITVQGSVTTQDMNMSNLNGTANEVDNTKGSWSIQEGADDLFLINRVSGKKYKFNLTEIS